MLGVSKFDMAFNLPSTVASQGYNVPSPFSLCYERSLSLFNSQTGPLLNHRGNLATSSVTEFKPLMKNDLRTGDSLVPSRLNSSLRILDPDLSDSYLKAAGILLSMKNSAMFRVNSTCQSTWTLSPPPIVSNFDIDVHPRMSIPWIKDTSQFGNQLFSEKNISSVNNTLEWKLQTTGNDDSSASNELEKTAIIPPRAQHQCKICHKIYGRLSALKTHLKLHRDKKAYKCEECGKLFSQQANLKAHHRTHTGEKPFQCKICKRRFAQSSSVTTHMRTHSGERPYQCTICRRGFADSSTLTKHIRVHTGERPYQCDVCHTKFSQSGNLKRHMSIHGKHSKLSQDLIVEN